MLKQNAKQKYFIFLLSPAKMHWKFIYPTMHFRLDYAKFRNQKAIKIILLK